MDTGMAVELALGLLNFILMGYVNSVRSSIKEGNDDTKKALDLIRQLELKVVGEYVKNDQFTRFSSEIFKSLDEIKDMLHKKADRRDHEQ
jgi:hypothetical protein